MGVAADSTRQAILDTMADLEKQIEVATTAKINRLLNDYYALQAALRHIKDKKALSRHHKLVLVRYLRDRIHRAKNHQKVHQAEKKLTEQLNYGGIFSDGPQYGTRIRLAYRQGSHKEEIRQLKRCAREFINLAKALEAADTPLLTKKAPKRRSQQ